MDEIVFEKLRVYQDSLRFVKTIYLLTEKFPSSEQFGLTSQFRRAAISIVLNIAESQGRNSPGEKKNFITISRGSAFECLALIDILFQVNLINSIQKAEFRSQTFSIVRQLNQLKKHFE